MPFSSDFGGLGVLDSVEHSLMVTQGATTLIVRHAILDVGRYLIAEILAGRRANFIQFLALGTGQHDDPTAANTDLANEVTRGMVTPVRVGNDVIQVDITITGPFVNPITEMLLLFDSGVPLLKAKLTSDVPLDLNGDLHILWELKLN